MTNIDESTIRSLPDQQIITEYQWLSSQKHLDKFKQAYKSQIDREIKRRSISIAKLKQ